MATGLKNSATIYEGSLRPSKMNVQVSVRHSHPGVGESASWHFHSKSLVSLQFMRGDHPDEEDTKNSF